MGGFKQLSLNNAWLLFFLITLVVWGSSPQLSAVFSNRGLQSFKNSNFCNNGNYFNWSSLTVHPSRPPPPKT